LADQYRAGSTWSVADGIALTASIAEWDAFEVAFGEVSLLNAIEQASTTGGASEYDATVGASGDYADVNAAIAAGKVNVLIIEDVTEDSDVTILAEDTAITLANNVTWTVNAYDIDMGAFTRIAIWGRSRDNSIIVRNNTADGDDFIKGGLGDSLTGGNFKYDNSASTQGGYFNGAQMVVHLENTWFLTPNTGGGGLELNGPANVNNIRITGGGTSSGQNVFVVKSGGVMTNVYIDGTWAGRVDSIRILPEGLISNVMTNISQAMVLDVQGGSLNGYTMIGSDCDVDVTALSQVSNVKCYGFTVSGGSAGSVISGVTCNDIDISATGKQVVITGLSVESNDTFAGSDCSVFGLDMDSSGTISGSRNTIHGWSSISGQTLTLSGSDNVVVFNTAGNVVISGDNNIISGYIGGTLTINATADKTLITNLSNVGALTDNGTNTKKNVIWDEGTYDLGTSADYAGIFFSENVTEMTIDRTDLWHLVTDWDTNQPNNISTSDQANNKIDIGDTAVYEVQLAASGQSAATAKTISHAAFDISGTTATITNITQANPAVVTTSAAHGYSNGETVKITGVVGMVEVNDKIFTVANVASTTFELQDDEAVNVDSTGYTAYSSVGTAALATITTSQASREHGSTDIGSLSGSGLHSATSGDSIEYYLKNRTDATNFTFDKGSLHLKRMN
jgi:hypothetical protein